MRKIENRRRLASNQIHLDEGTRVGGIWKLWKAMRSKNACKTCARNGWPGRRHGQRRRAISPRSVKNRCKRWSPTCKERSSRSSGPLYSTAQLQSFTLASLNTAAALRNQSSFAKASNTISRFRGTKSSQNHHKAQTAKSKRDVLVFQRARSRRNGILIANVCPHLRYKQRQQLQLLLPSGKRCRAHFRNWDRSRNGSARRPGKSRTLFLSSVATQRATTPV